MTKLWTVLKQDWKRQAIAAFVVVGALGIFVWWLQTESYQGPAKTEERVGDLGRSSTTVIPITASLDEIQTKLNEQIPSALYTIDENRDDCVPAQWVEYCLIPRPWPFSGCIQTAKTQVTPSIDCHVDGAATRGAIHIGGTGNVLNLTMPVSAHVTVRGRGDIGKNIQSTADGSITAAVSVQADVNENWQPSAKVDADYSWDNRIGVDVLGFRITFASKVDPKIKDAIESFKEKIPALLANLDLKDQASKAWSKGFTTIQVAKAPDVWLRFSPGAIGYNGYNVDGRILRVNIMAGGKTETFVGKKPTDSPVLPLPPLKRALPDPGFNFFVPISADYAALIDAAKKGLKLGETQTFDVPGTGAVKVVVKDVTIYQTTGKKMAIGVTLDADSPGSIFHIRGAVWLIANVSIDNDKKRVKIDSLEVHSQTNNAPIDLLLSIVQLDPINRAIRKAIEYDFSPKYQDVLKQANDALNRQVSDDFYIVGKVDSLAADQIVVAPDAFVAALSAKGTVELRLGKLSR